MKLLEEIRKRAQESGRHLVLPEGHDERMIKAAAEMNKEGSWKITLVGNENDIKTKAADLGCDLSRTKIVDPDGGEVGYTYDAANRMEKVVSPDDKTTYYEYDGAGRV